VKILLVYPRHPEAYWSFSYALKFIAKKAGSPPLGLLTIAAMLPREWDKKLVDMNVSALKDRDILWADYVFISAMDIQRESAQMVVARCREFGVKTVAGGPLFTSWHEEFDQVDHLILNEGELTLPSFLHDLQNGTAQHVYSSDGWADLRTTPVPDWNLVDLRKYAIMNIQYSRGCPFDCDFCDITVLYGHTPRTKQVTQLLGELDALYKKKWRGEVFIVDDNFIGNKRKLKEEILPALIEWMNERKYPFSFQTEASINLSDDDELMRMMVRAGFDTVFIGIESPNEESLVECNKQQNKNRDLIACVHKIRSFGLQVQGGFIVGFDNDKMPIFDRLIAFIQKSGIVSAMVGLLLAPKGTRLHARLAEEGRLIDIFSGSNTSIRMNFVPKMNLTTLIAGYKRIIETIYHPKHYYERVTTFLKNFSPVRHGRFHFRFNDLYALLRANIRLGIFGKERLYYWKLYFWSLFTRPSLFPMAIKFSIYGFHFRKVFATCLSEADAVS